MVALDAPLPTVLCLTFVITLTAAYPNPSDVQNIGPEEFANALISNQPIFQLVNQPCFGKGGSANDGSDMMEKLLAALEIVNKTQVMVDELSTAQDTKMTSSSQELSKIKELQTNLNTIIQEYITADMDQVGSLKSDVHELKGQVGDLQENIIHQVDSVQLENVVSSVERLQEQINVLHETINALNVCPPLFFPLGERCFRFNSTAKQNWDDARQTCKRLGSDLANPIDIEELITEIRSISQSRFYLGGSDRDLEGSWVTLSGQPIPMSREIWMDGEPNNSGEEDCLEVYGEVSTYNDVECSIEIPFVCEYFRA